MGSCRYSCYRESSARGWAFWVEVAQKTFVVHWQIVMAKGGDQQATVGVKGGVRWEQMRILGSLRYGY